MRSALRMHDRRGFTLVELLVVVSILVILTVFALPAITPSVEKRKIREASRAVNVMLGSARTRAMETGRNAGVIFSRNPNLKQSSATLFLAEVPPPWAGDETGSTIKIEPAGGSYKVTFTKGEDPVAYGLVHVGDELQLGYSGHRWRIESISGSFNWSFSSRTTTMPPVTGVDTNGDGTLDNVWAMPFRIFRQPMRSSAAPLQLPSTAVVDLRWSGVGIGTFAAAFQPASNLDETDVAIMFSPNGDVAKVWYSGGDAKVTEPIYLLIGQQQRVPAAWDGTTSPAEDQLLNYQDLENLWVVVSPQTGVIKTAPVAAVSSSWIESRIIAATGESMGGK